jgi:hypothetical protein
MAIFALYPLDMRKYLFFISLLLWLGALQVSAQTNPYANERELLLPIRGDAQRLDSLTVLPASVEVWIKGERVDATFFNYSNQRIRFLPPAFAIKADSALVKYRTLPFDLEASVSRVDSFDQKGAILSQEEIRYDPFQGGSPLASYRGLDYNGNFSRGLSFGNSQNLVLNSNFNLQMAGSIGDGVELLAAITDENIPIQPQGNTQQLNEFDKIFIQLKKDNNKLIAGDYEIGRPEGYFMNYYKKLQGATFENQVRVGEKGVWSNKASLALARGKFARNSILGQEGNQGPYKLEGAEGERFIIVLAGTERVFIDGLLMERGLEGDYVIDYNRGDITFTPNRLITKDIRIIIEFEYNVQSYLRSLYAVNSTYQTERFSLYVNGYSEQDGRTTVGEEDITPEQRSILSEAGDDPLKAVIPSIDTASTSTDPIRYRLVDTLVNGILFEQILVYAPTPAEGEELFVARFSNVGQGNGNYTRPPSNANGFVYTWVAPNPNGTRNGSYEPVVQLIAPKQKQLWTAGGNYRISEKGSIKAEVALSRNDLNRFSQDDGADDLGLGASLVYDQEIQLNAKWTTDIRAYYEGVQEFFTPLNPYRAPEFQRDWNLNNTEKTTEQLSGIQVGLGNDSLGFAASYGFNGFWRTGLYQGRKQTATLFYNQDGWLADIQGNLLQSEAGTERSRFSRPKITLSKTFQKLGNWQVGMYGEREKNELLNAATDSLQTGSFYYDLYRLYLKSPEEKPFQVGLTYSERIDFTPKAFDFAKLADAKEYKVEGRFRQQRLLQLNWNLNYRQLMILDTLETQQQPAETYLGRLDLNLTPFKGAVRYNASYQIGSGQEQKLLFVYQPVLDGAGIYQHIDFNDDGIEQTNEFVIAPTADLGTHNRVIIYTNEFIRTNNVVFNQSLSLDPRALWFSEKGFKKLLARFSTVSTWQINRNVRDLEGVNPWNPFDLNLTDTALVSTRTFIQSTLFFNRSDPTFGFQLSWSDNQSKLILTTGLEGRRTIEQSLQVRWNFNRQFSLLNKLSLNNRQNEFENFLDRNYDISGFTIEPQLTWLPKPIFRTALSYRYEASQNTEALGGETGRFNDLSLEITWNQKSLTSFRSSFSFVQVKFDGDPTSAVGFAFLNGLQNGNNYLWNLTIDRQLAKNVRLGISYEGRKTGSAQVVHVGRAQVGAVF